MFSLEHNNIYILEDDFFVRLSCGTLLPAAKGIYDRDFPFNLNFVDDAEKLREDEATNHPLNE